MLQVSGEKTLKIGSQPPSLLSDTSTELKLLYALQRRGVAMDQCGLLSWDEHLLWTQKLFDTVCREPPVGFVSTTLSQAIRADQELWVLLSEEVKPPFKPSPAGIPKLNAPFRAMTLDVRVSQFLLPLPKHFAKVGGEKRQHPGGEGTGGPKKKTKTKAEPKAPYVPKSLPESLKQYKTRVPAGNICWNYNLDSGCDLTTSKDKRGPKCKRGYHFCAKCHKPGHSVVNCRS